MRKSAAQALSVFVSLSLAFPYEAAAALVGKGPSLTGKVVTIPLLTTPIPSVPALAQFPFSLPGMTPVPGLTPAPVQPEGVLPGLDARREAVQEIIRAAGDPARGTLEELSDQARRLMDQDGSRPALEAAGPEGSDPAAPPARGISPASPGSDSASQSPAPPAPPKPPQPRPSRLKRALLAAARFTGVSAVWNLLVYGSTVEKYADQLTDPGEKPGTRAEAARKLGRLGLVETIEVLDSAAAGDPDPGVREAAKQALLSSFPAWTPRFIRDLHVHPLPGRRTTAARNLAVIARHSQAPEAVEALAYEAAMDISRDVRLASIEALGTARSPKALQSLVWMQDQAPPPGLRSALEVAAARATEVQKAAGRRLLYRPPAGEFENGKQPLYSAALKRVIAVSAVFVAIEAVGGLMTGSLSLKADAMHLAADLAINVGALVSIWMSRRPPSSRKTYGLLKMESVTGLVSALLISGMSAFTLIEAVHRLWAPVAVPGLATVLLALSGLASNAISTMLLYRYRDENLSMKGAFLHAATDAVGSVGIIVAGLLIWAFGWFIADPIISFLIVALIAHTTWDLGKRSWQVLIDAVPPGVDLDALEADLLAVPGALSVHDLHVWSLNSSETVLTAALFVRPGSDLEGALKAAKAVVSGKHGIRHSTIQVEYLKP